MSSINPTQIHLLIPMPYGSLARCILAMHLAIGTSLLLNSPLIFTVSPWMMKLGTTTSLLAREWVHSESRKKHTCLSHTIGWLM